VIKLCTDQQIVISESIYRAYVGGGRNKAVFPATSNFQYTAYSPRLDEDHYLEGRVLGQLDFAACPQRLDKEHYLEEHVLEGLNLRAERSDG
jgi:hypothetical protein